MIFPANRVLTPDDVRRHHPSVREAIETDGWPTLREARGKVAFCIINSDDRTKDYTYNYTHLRGRAMFIRANPDQFHMPWAAMSKQLVYLV